MAVKLTLVFAVVIGVASALVAALVVVLCKCLWVWWRFHKTHRGRSLTQETYFVHQKGKWPTGITYQTYENCSVADSLSSGEEPYIIETPGDFGKLQFSVEYNTEEKVITIGLVQAKGIICQTNLQTAFLYAVVQLCKDEKIVDEREIEKQKMTFGPQWNEELFLSSGENPIETLALRIQLMELDSFSTSHLIGQVVLSLDEGEFNETHPKWYDIMPGSTEASSHEHVGELLLSLNYFPTTQRLTIVILKARNLRIESQTGLWGPSVKVFLMLNSARLGRKRTAMQKKTLNPVYNEAFTFKVTSETLQRVSFKVVVVNKHSQGPDEQIGHVLLGQNVTGSGMSHWNHMLTSLRKPVAMWHLVIPNT